MYVTKFVQYCLYLFFASSLKPAIIHVTAQLIHLPQNKLFVKHLDE